MPSPSFHEESEPQALLSSFATSKLVLTTSGLIDALLGFQPWTDHQKRVDGDANSEMDGIEEDDVDEDASTGDEEIRSEDGDESSEDQEEYEEEEDESSEEDVDSSVEGEETEDDDCNLGAEGEEDANSEGQGAEEESDTEATSHEGERDQVKKCAGAAEEDLLSSLQPKVRRLVCKMPPAHVVHRVPRHCSLMARIVVRRASVAQRAPATPRESQHLIPAPNKQKNKRPSVEVNVETLPKVACLSITTADQVELGAYESPLAQPQVADSQRTLIEVDVESVSKPLPSAHTSREQQIIPVDTIRNLGLVITTVETVDQRTNKAEASILNDFDCSASTVSTCTMFDDAEDLPAPSDGLPAPSEEDAMAPSEDLQAPAAMEDAHDELSDTRLVFPQLGDVHDELSDTRLVFPEVVLGAVLASERAEVATMAPLAQVLSMPLGLSIDGESPSPTPPPSARVPTPKFSCATAKDAPSAESEWHVQDSTGGTNEAFFSC